ncbi:hypothetical protein CEXT_674121 [Caerostris extrusa]|uniref:Uncharacterized protein n=1 Tax=Caerostris extrusa TaxID=172846 RepID=A0AAV4UU45_CAEEX|nr:hypothetical protein CEXT_674121 [Caerostris extrusa]
MHKVNSARQLRLNRWSFWREKGSKGMDLPCSRQQHPAARINRHMGVGRGIVDMRPASRRTCSTVPANDGAVPESFARRNLPLTIHNAARSIRQGGEGDDVLRLYGTLWR